MSMLDDYVKSFRKKVATMDPTGASLLVFEMEEELAKALYDKDIDKLKPIWQDMVDIMHKIKDMAVFENEYHRLWGLSYLIRKYIERHNEKI